MTWLDLRQTSPDAGEAKIEPPIGLIVPDVRAALVKIAALLRSESKAKVVTIVGAEGLRTCQRVMQSVLSQRFQTHGPDRLLCDAQSTAQGLLCLRPETERLLLRLDVADAQTTRSS